MHGLKGTFFESHDFGAMHICLEHHWDEGNFSAIKLRCGCWCRWDQELTLAINVFSPRVETKARAFGLEDHILLEMTVFDSFWVPLKVIHSS